jgi:hypothetical protein
MVDVDHTQKGKFSAILQSVKEEDEADIVY